MYLQPDIYCEVDCVLLLIHFSDIATFLSAINCFDPYIVMHHSLLKTL